MCIESADEQEDAVLNVHQVKKGGCLSNLLVSVLKSECTQRKTVVVMPKNIQSFRSFCRFRINAPLLNVQHPDLNDCPPAGFFVLINKNHRPICAGGSVKRITCVNLTGLGRWMAIALSLNVSLFGMCLAAEIYAHHAMNSSRMSAGRGAQYGAMDDGTKEMISPFTTIKFARRFPSCSRYKITRTLQDLEEAGMISVSKSMHCNTIRANPAHSLFSRYWPALSKLTEALHGLDTLERTSRSIAGMHLILDDLQCPRTC